MHVEIEDFRIEDLMKLKHSNMLYVNPEYQRGAVWGVPQKKRLIDSVLRGYPISLIYLENRSTSVAGRQRDDFEVIDGQQRINALYEFREGAFRLFDPVRNEAEARFPQFIAKEPCPWGGKDFDQMGKALQDQFLNLKLPVALVTTTNPNEARDLFIRLQAGMPLNAQEKRDAWPGNFTEFVLKLGGKPEIPRYPGHDFFKVLLGAKTASGRGKYRQLAAQLAMLYSVRRTGGADRFCDINSRAIDDFYYRHLDYDLKSPETERFRGILDRLTQLLGDKKRKTLQGHEALHLVLLVDSLLDDYTRGWEDNLPRAFDKFREAFAKHKLTRYEPSPGEFWTRYGAWTRANSDRASSILLRHEFFARKMFEWLSPQLKDPTRGFGELEREIVYYRDKKTCAVCDGTVIWADGEIHHVEEHAKGGRTVLDNGVLVHKQCHPKGAKAVEFAKTYRAGRGAGREEE